jgi:hypothetical protein
MKLHLPTYLGGYEVELNTDGISDDEVLIGWVDEYGTIISSRANVRIGDLVSIEDNDLSALILTKESGISP